MQGRYSPSAAFQQAAQQQALDARHAEQSHLRVLHTEHRRRSGVEPAISELEAQTRPAEQRWKPSTEQLEVLKAYYNIESPPSREQIREITAAISIHGVVDEPKVYYWYQNRRSRDKRKRHRLLQSSSSAAAVPAAEASSSSSSSLPPLDFDETLQTWSEVSEAIVMAALHPPPPHNDTTGNSYENEVVAAASL